MNRYQLTTIVLLACTFLPGCTGSRRAYPSNLSDESVRRAHDTYVAAINTNNLDTIMGVMTDDVVFMAPGTPRMVGKDEIRPWAEGFFEAFDAHWDKTAIQILVTGEWAIEQYAFVSTGKPKSGGPTLHETGKGIIVYHRENDGQWRVARDAWNLDTPADQ